MDTHLFPASYNSRMTWAGTFSAYVSNRELYDSSTPLAVPSDTHLTNGCAKATEKGDA